MTRTPNGSNFFQFPSVKVGVIRSRLYTGKTDLKLDSLSFLTVITKLTGIVHFRVVHMGSECMD